MRIGVAFLDTQRDADPTAALIDALTHQPTRPPEGPSRVDHIMAFGGEIR